jgi:hypothetical protein
VRDPVRALHRIRWEFLPQELGFGSGMTCWRRLRDWNDAGVWQRLHEVLLAELRGADLLDFSKIGPSPVDRGKTGSKHHVIVEAHGIPLAATLTGGNRNDVTELIPLIQAVPPIRASAVDPASARRRSTPIAATTTTNTATRSAHWASPRSSPGAEPDTAPAWASIAGTSLCDLSGRLIGQKPRLARARTNAGVRNGRASKRRHRGEV